MQKILEYKIVYASNSQFLEEEVNKAIKEGWQPLGGAFIEGGVTYSYNQVVVKYA